MRFPIIPMVSGTLAALGLTGLWWYSQLSQEKKEEADEEAMAYARQLYNKKLGELSFLERKRVLELVQAQMGS